MSERIKKLTITAFRAFVGGLVNAPQLFKFCVTEGQLVEQEKNWSYKILSISQPG